MTTTCLEEKARALYKGEALAPMVRASTTPLRTLALKYGADFVYTEELVDRSLSSTLRVENKELGTIDYIKDASSLSKKVQKRLDKGGVPALVLRIDPKIEYGKLVCQIGTGEPELALPAALHVHQDVDSIDVNMGCPKKFSVSGGMGSALLDDPDRACRIIRTLTEGLSCKNIPVTAKIRLLENNTKTIDFISGLINAGAKAVAVHGRTVGHDATDPALWERLEEVVSLSKSKFPRVPILLNGDFYTRKEFDDFQKKTKADGVLLARPALYNTSIFRKPKGESNHKYGYDSPLLLDKTTVVKDYLREAVRYHAHYKNVKYVICEMMSNRRLPSPRTPFMPQKWPGGQTINSVCSCQTLEAICKVWDVNNQKHLSNSSTSHATAGEHRYEDSYFLVRENQSAPVGDPPAAKRARIDPAYTVEKKEK